MNQQEFDSAVAEAERAWSKQSEWDAAIAGAKSSGATIDDFLALQAVSDEIKGVSSKTDSSGAQDGQGH